MKIVLDSAAASEMEQAARFYEDCREGLGHEFMASVEDELRSQNAGNRTQDTETRTSGHSAFRIPGFAFCLFSVVALLLASRLHAGFTRVTDGEIVNDGGWCYGCAWADYDGDGFPDVFATNNNANQHKNNFLYLNNGDGTFTKVTDGPVVLDSGSSYGCAWGDYDNDGFPDLFVSNYGENNALYHNNGDGSFTKITTGRIVNDGGNSTGAAWADYDRDGWLDLFVCNRGQVNFLYHNNGDGTFTRILTGEIATDINNSSGCAWADYDNDGWHDLFVANVQTPNCLYHNNGDGTFTRVRSEPFASDSSFCNGASWGDYDNDGNLDLLVPTGVLGTYHDLLYHNEDGGTFTKVTGTPIDSPLTWSGGSGWADWDNDGDLDLLIAMYDGLNRMYLNNGDGTFTRMDTGSIASDGSYYMGIGWADYDRDGWPDVFLAHNGYFSGSNSLYHNDGGTNHWLSVHCIGTVSNRMAVGARLLAIATISGQRVRQIRELSTQTGGGNSGQGFINACFGLGDATVIDSLVVRWPSGIVQTLTAVNADQFLTITEAGTAVSESPRPKSAPVLSRRPISAPSPFRDFTSVPGHAGERFTIYDAAGRPLRTDLGNRIGAALAPGIYYLKSRSSAVPAIKIVKVR